MLRSKPALFAGFSLLVALTLIVDARTILLVPFTSVYMVILFFASKQLGQRPVYALAALCVAGTLGLDLFMIRQPQDAGLIVSWRLLINALSFFGTALMCNSWNRVHRQLRQQSDRDFLTQMSNRRCFMRELEREVRTHCRQKRPFAIAFFDVDDFKRINDTRGHKFGDRVLISVAQSLGQSVRSMDRSCRYGGDEFVVFLGETDAGKARAAIDRIRRRLLAEVGAIYADISLSTGVVTFDLQEPMVAEELIAQADREMYRIKKQGKSGVSLVRFSATGPLPAQAST